MCGDDIHMHAIASVCYQQRPDQARGSHFVNVISCVGTEVAQQVTDLPAVGFDLPELAKGLYFVRVKDQASGNTHIQKLVIQ